MPRLDQDAGWLAVAAAVAQRADCRRRQVGAVVVDTADRVVSTGRNGYPSHGGSCLAGDCPRGLLSYEQQPADAPYRDCRAVHAEANALIWGDPARMAGGTIYITHPPCPDCAKLLAGSGLATAVWPGGQQHLAPGAT